MLIYALSDFCILLIYEKVHVGHNTLILFHKGTIEATWTFLTAELPWAAKITNLILNLRVDQTSVAPDYYFWNCGLIL